MHQLMTALIVPFNDDFSINEAQYRRLIQTQLDHGITCVVVNGTTGEAPTLSLPEKRFLVETALSMGIEVIAGVSSNSTQHMIEEIQNVNDLAISGLMICAPYYNKTTQAGLIAHFQKAAEQTDKKIMIYNIPGRTSMPIQIETLKQLAKNPQFYAIKEASNDLNYLKKIRQHCPELTLYNGNDDLIVECSALGVDGLISAIGNAIPDKMSHLNRLIGEGDYGKASSYFFEIYPLISKTYDVVNPIGVKALAQITQQLSDVVRLPLLQEDDAYRNELKALL